MNPLVSGNITSWSCINQVPEAMRSGGQDDHEVVVGPIGLMGVFCIDRRRRPPWSLYQEAAR